MIYMKKSSDNAGGAERHGKSSSLHDKSLYICSQSEEYGYGRRSSTSWHIHALNLSHLLLPSPPPNSSNSNTNLLRAVTTRIADHDVDLPACCVFASKILFVGGRSDQSSSQVYEFETTDPPKQQQIKKACFPSFVNGRERALLMELDDGKLYAVSRHYKPEDPPLMAFDPREGLWSALPYPPLPESGGRWWDVCCATVGTDILVWSPKYDPKVLYFFDTAARRWTKRSTVDPLISSEGGRALVLNCEDGGFIMFTYTCTCDWDGNASGWDGIQVFHMSKEYEHLRHIESHHMLHHDQFPPARQGGSGDSYSFVHLGGRQVCLVLGSQIWRRGESKRLTIVVVMFEYAMANKKKRGEPMSGKLDFLTTRLVKFDHLDPLYTRADMLGAFVVPPPPPPPQPAPVVLPNT